MPKVAKSKPDYLIGCCDKLAKLGEANPDQLPPDVLAAAFLKYFEVPPPLTTETLNRIFKTCGIEWRLCDMPGELTGFCMQTPNGWEITCQGRSWAGGLMFPALHEFRHIISETLKMLNLISSPPPDMERACERFAAAAMMPTPWFRDVAHIARFNPVDLHKFYDFGYQAPLIRITDLLDEEVPLLICRYENKELETLLDELGPSKLGVNFAVQRSWLERPDHYVLTQRYATKKMYALEYVNLYEPLLAIRTGACITDDYDARVALEHRSDLYKIRWPAIRPPGPNFNGGVDAIVDVFIAQLYGIVSQIFTVTIPYEYRERLHLLGNRWGPKGVNW